MNVKAYPFQFPEALLYPSNRSWLLFMVIFFVIVLVLPSCSHAGSEEDHKDMQLIINSVTQAIEDVHAKIESNEKMLKDFKVAHEKFGQKNSALEKEVKTKEKEIGNLKDIMKKTEKKLEELQKTMNDEKKSSEEANSKLSKSEKEKLQALEEKAKLEQDKLLALEEKAKLLDEKKKFMSSFPADQKNLALERDEILKQAKKGREEFMNKARKEKDEILKQNKKKEQELLQELEREKKNRGEMMKRLESVETDLKYAIKKSEKIQISQWLQQQARSVGDYLESPDTSMLLSSALDSAFESVKAGIDSFASLEHDVNTKIDTIYSSSYNSHISKFIAYAAVLLPVLFIYYLWSLLSSVLTIRHIVFFFSCFNSSFFGACLLVSLTLKQDPLYAVMKTSKTNLLILCLGLAAQFFLYCYSLFVCIIRSEGLWERMNFAFQLALYFGVGIAFRNRVFKPVLHRVSFPPFSALAYLQYLSVLGLMLVLTIMSSIGTPMGDVILGPQATSAFNFPRTGETLHRTGETLPRSALTTMQTKSTKPSSNISPLDVPFRGDSPGVLRAIARRLSKALDR